MLLKSSKINEFRLWGLVLILIGMGVMIVGTAGIVFWGQTGKIIAGIFMVIGMFALLISVGVYFWAGMLSTSAVMLICPECRHQTKILGRTDRCMFCRTILTLDADNATHGLETDDESAASAPDTSINGSPNTPSSHS